MQFRILSCRGWLYYRKSFRFRDCVFHKTTYTANSWKRLLSISILLLHENIAWIDGNETTSNSLFAFLKRKLQIRSLHLKKKELLNSNFSHPKKILFSLNKPILFGILSTRKLKPIPILYLDWNNTFGFE